MSVQWPVPQATAKDSLASTLSSRILPHPLQSLSIHTLVSPIASPVSEVGTRRHCARVTAGSFL
eukprot:1012719-Amphidinium_carterae.1